MGLFKKAVKHESKLRLAIAGPSGSGKTYTALAVATHLADSGKIALVDTEYGSASKYAGDLFHFDVAEMSAPYDPRKYVKAIEEAAQAGYEVLIIDSLSHAWFGTGGVLEIVDKAAVRFKGNSYAAWGEGTPIHNALIEAIVSAPIHIIATMRSKTEYVLQEVKGKQIPQKVGMAPIQRDNVEYEFDVFIEMDMDNNGIVRKTRCPALTNAVLEKPGADLAQTLRDWLHGAPDDEPNDPILNAEEAADGEMATTMFDDLESASASANGDKPDPFQDARDSLKGTTSTLADIATAAVMTGLYEVQPHAWNAVKLYDWPESDKFELVAGQKVKTETARTVLDWMITRKLDEQDKEQEAA